MPANLVAQFRDFSFDGLAGGQLAFPCVLLEGSGVPLEELLELFDRQTSVTRDTAHRKGIHRIMSRDSEDANSI